MRRKVIISTLLPTRSVPGPYLLQLYRHGANTALVRLGPSKSGEIDQNVPSVSLLVTIKTPQPVRKLLNRLLSGTELHGFSRFSLIIIRDFPCSSVPKTILFLYCIITPLPNRSTRLLSRPVYRKGNARVPIHFQNNSHHRL